MPRYTCRVCGRKIETWREPEEDDDLICLRCEERRDDARMWPEDDLEDYSEDENVEP